MIEPSCDSANDVHCPVGPETVKAASLKRRSAVAKRNLAISTEFSPGVEGKSSTSGRKFWHLIISYNGCGRILKLYNNDSYSWEDLIMILYIELSLPRNWHWSNSFLSPLLCRALGVWKKQHYPWPILARVGRTTQGLETSIWFEPICCEMLWYCFCCPGEITYLIYLMSKCHKANSKPFIIIPGRGIPF